MGSGPRQGTPHLTGVQMAAASAADLSEVVALERACYGDPWPASAFASLLSNSRVFFAVARVHGRMAGYVVAWHVMDEGELANLAVEPSFRRQGIGRALLDAALTDAASRGTTQIYLEVRESNAAARGLYAARGFEVVGRRKQYYRTPREDALILRRLLES